jgi:hypothetical protein
MYNEYNFYNDNDSENCPCFLVDGSTSYLPEHRKTQSYD